jgi:hypothetical protein
VTRTARRNIHLPYRVERALVLDTILPSSHRWQGVEIYALRDTVDDLSPIRNDLPLFRSLTLGIYDTNVVQPCCCDAFEVAPALRTIDLVGLNVFPTSFKLPWTHLTDFSSHDTRYTPTECLEILRLCPNLTSSRFGLISDYPIEPTTPHLRHCRLVNLRISPKSSHTSHSSFFDCLTLPALRAVCLDPRKTSRSNSWPGQQVLDLLQRSLRTLEKFTWGLDSVKIENIIRCLESMPELQIMPALDHSLLELLQSLTLGAPDETETRLCPKLRAVQLSIDHSFDVGALSAFIRSCRKIETVRDRTDRFKCIRLLSLVKSWEPETTLRDLKEFQDDGLVNDVEGELHQVVLQ